MNSKDTVTITSRNNDPDEEKLKKNVNSPNFQNMEIFNFKNVENNPNYIHQMDEEQNIKLDLNDVNLPKSNILFNQFTFKGKKDNSDFNRNITKNNNPFIISSARLPETQKILNSFRDLQQEVNNTEVKNSATSNKASVTCLICFDKLPDAVFMECGHGGIF